MVVKPAVFVAVIISFAVGSILTYFVTTTNVDRMKSADERSMLNMATIAQTQAQIIGNYNEAYGLLADCTIADPNNCDFKAGAEKLDSLRSERDKLINYLEQSQKN